MRARTRTHVYLGVGVSEYLCDCVSVFVGVGVSGCLFVCIHNETPEIGCCGQFYLGMHVCMQCVHARVLACIDTHIRICAHTCNSIHAPTHMHPHTRILS